jgi:ribonucleotide reductase beta subunit family protein with ferritin-like domain
MGEPLLEERLTLFPIRFPALDALCKKHRSTYWTPEEIVWERDSLDWGKISDNEKRMLKLVLSFFAVADGIVMENVNDNFAREIKAPEARNFYAVQNCIESIHVETYNMAIMALMPEPKEHTELLNNVHKYMSIAAKRAFAERWMSDDAPLAERLVAFSCLEGIMFSASFAVIYWYKDKGLFPGLVSSNEFISRDEALHTDFAVALHGHLVDQVKPSTIAHIVREAVDVECVFVADAIKPVPGLPTRDEWRTYVQLIGDRLMAAYGVDAEHHYGAKLPASMKFMHMIGVDQKTNFFEHRPTQYHKHEPSNEFAMADVF